MSKSRYLLFLTFLVVVGVLSGGERWLSAAWAAGETPKDMLAAQIRSQGMACDRALRATRDAKRSGPDHEVWVLKCQNATYRIARYPDMAAKVEQLR
ncbi:hypothetical protein Q3C01_38595 [Bradyrhizobium sp. UFLA05-109]